VSTDDYPDSVAEGAEYFSSMQTKTLTLMPSEAAEIALCIHMRADELSKPPPYAYLETESMKRNRALIDWLRKTAYSLTAGGH
jgi:hypothetical protein